MQFDELSIEELNRITIEATQGIPPSITTPEALAARAVLEKQVKEIMARGHMVDLLPE